MDSVVRSDSVRPHGRRGDRRVAPHRWGKPGDAGGGDKVIPGDSEGSDLVVVQETGSHAGQFIMEEIDTIREWIEAGAP